MRVLLTSGACLGALLGAEALVAWVHPLPFTRNTAWLGPATGDAEAIFRLDPEMGFCPIASGYLYSSLGTLVNSYPERKRPNRARVLFLGDSVTARGRIVRALQRAVGDDPRFGWWKAGIEWWNAGVESFNAVQSVQWYERRTHQVAPELVVFTLHPNDLLGTGVCFLDGEGNLILYREGSEPRRVHPWLYRESHLYRRLVAPPPAQRLPLEEAKRRTRDALERLKVQLAREGADLFLFALPWSQDPGEWSEEMRTLFEAMREIAATSGVAWCDGFEPLQGAVVDRLELPERPNDPWHPGDALSDRFARAMLAAGLFEPLKRRADAWLEAKADTGAGPASAPF